MQAKTVGALNAFDGAFRVQLHTGLTAFGAKKVHDLSRGSAAEELAQSFFIIRNVVLLHQLDEFAGGITREGGSAEVWVVGEIIFRAGMEIGEIAATAARDKNFFADTTIVLQHKHSSTAQTGRSRTHQACATRANDNGVELLNGLIRRLAHAVRGLVHVKQFIRIE